MVKVFKRENWPLLSAGMANDMYYPPEEIEACFQNTIWDEKTCSIIADHLEPGVKTWVGKVDNLRYDSVGDLRGDIYIYDLNEINKLEGGAMFGISPEIVGIDRDGAMVDFNISRFSLVWEPAVKTTYLNSDKDGVHLKTTYIHPNAFKSCDLGENILIKSLVKPEHVNFCYLNDKGDLVYKPDSGGGNTMSKSKQKLSETRDDNEVEETDMEKVLRAIEELSKRLEKVEASIEGPEEEVEEENAEEEEDGKDDEKDDEEEEVEAKNQDEDVAPEDPTADVVAVLKEVNPELGKFTETYLKDHKSEAPAKHLITLAAKEFVLMQKTKELAGTKAKLQEARRTVRQDTPSNPNTISFEEVRIAQAQAMLAAQNGM
jgi:hypothetical protein